MRDVMLCFATETEKRNNVAATVSKVFERWPENATILICGSFYMMADAKRAINTKKLQIETTMQ